ncbi:response regulator [Pedobacter sp. GSP4]|uniref:response regulator n=1 Tax=Pedobacter sp. GSP4 TaxID=3453716 RepID=UPI003EEAC2EB
MFSGKEQIKIVVIDDHPVVAAGLESLLAKEKGFDVIAIFACGLDSLPFIEENEVDIVILDISLPDVNGVDLCRRIKSISPKISVLALSNHTERILIMQMLQNGASGYMLKNSPISEIVSCIHECLLGGIAYSKEVKDIILKPAINELNERPKITKREKQVLKLIEEGKTTIAMAEMLFVSPLTIETHRRNLMQKFGVKNALELIKISREQLLL